MLSKVNEKIKHNGETESHRDGNGLIWFMESSWHVSIWPSLHLSRLFDPFFFYLLYLPSLPPPFLSLPTLFLPHPINWLPVHHQAPRSLLEGCQVGMRGM